MIREEVGQSVDGFVILPDAIDAAAALERLPPCADPDRGFHASSVHGSTDDAVEVDALVRSLLTDLFAARGLAPFLGALVHKGPTSLSRVDLHQDLTYTDERVERAVHVWIPLVDVDDERGTLSVVPGSHRWSNGIRSRTDLPPTTPHLAALDGLAVPLALAAGSAVLYDPALIHGSGPNVSGRPRPALVAAATRPGVPLLHFFPGTDGELEGRWLDPKRPAVTQLYHHDDAGQVPVVPWAPAVVSDDLAPFTIVGATDA